MGESRNEAKDRDKQNNIQGASQDTTQRLRLDSYVNIDEDEIHIESEAAEEVKKPSDEPICLKIVGNTKERCKSLSDLFPCGVCGDDLGRRYKGKSVLCMGCMHWCHLTKCSGLSGEKEYKKGDYRCPTCVNQLLVNKHRCETENTSSQENVDGDKEKVNENKKPTEIRKPRGRKVSFFDNSPIVTGGIEFPELKRKRKTREIGSPDSSEKKSDEEKSPIPKKTKKNYKITKNDNKEVHKLPQKDDQITVDKSRFKECIDCKQRYDANCSNSKTKIKCFGCNDNKHDCLKDDIFRENIKVSKGLIWICGECIKIFKQEKTPTGISSKNDSNKPHSVEPKKKSKEN